MHKNHRGGARQGHHVQGQLQRLPAGQGRWVGDADGDVREAHEGGDAATRHGSPTVGRRSIRTRQHRRQGAHEASRRPSREALGGEAAPVLLPERAAVVADRGTRGGPHARVRREDAVQEHVIADRPGRARGYDRRQRVRQVYPDATDAGQGIPQQRCRCPGLQRPVPGELLLSEPSRGAGQQHRGVGDVGAGRARRGPQRP
mmetsp:Transcript_2271/g.3565  ORF Transcript_2271/g.3565 Transcript_2271/m.3565 type:complete len:202 (+) Transcript_2271:61-666(+)